MGRPAGCGRLLADALLHRRLRLAMDPDRLLQLGWVLRLGRDRVILGYPRDREHCASLHRPLEAVLLMGRAADGMTEIASGTEVGMTEAETGIAMTVTEIVVGTTAEGEAAEEDEAGETDEVVDVNQYFVVVREFLSFRCFCMIATACLVVHSFRLCVRILSAF